MIPETCPSCHAKMQGDPIHEKHREAFGGKTHYSRIISMYDVEEDRTTHYRCPECQFIWRRDVKEEAL